MSGRTIGFAVTGSFCTHEKIKKVIEELVNQGEKVIPVFSPICQHTDSRFGKCEDFIKDIQKITKEKGIFTIPEAEPIVLRPFWMYWSLHPVQAIRWQNCRQALRILLF